MVPEHLLCMRVLTNSIGWVKLQVMTAALPPSPMDASTVGLDMLCGGLWSCAPAPVFESILIEKRGR